MNDQTQIELVKIVRRLDTVEADVAILKQNVAHLKTDMYDLKQDISAMKSDMTHMRGQIDVIVGLLSKAMQIPSP